MTASPKKFRDVFKISKDIVNWYPGHMNFSFKHMQAKMRNIDCVVEVHDSRIPFSGRNPLFVKSLLGTKPHILVLNKVDLINPSYKDGIKEKLEEVEGCENVVFTNCLDQSCEGLRGIKPLISKLTQTTKSPLLTATKYRLMVVGIPNVGKSSFINVLRNININRGKATAVGGIPGITKSVQTEIKISTNPPLYLIDTPGILVPNILDIECGMKLALCACIKDDTIGIIFIADFLLYWMNKTSKFLYVDMFKLGEPVDNIMPLLIKIAMDENKMKKVKNIINNSIQVVPDIEYSAKKLVTLFRKGKFGDLMLDSCILS